MGLSKVGMDRFGAQVDALLEGLFPGELEVGGVGYECACAGGREFRDFDRQGLPVTRRERLVRVRKELLSAENLPGIGEEVVWTPEGGEAQTLRVLELPARPHESAWALRCEEA